ncbi:geranylgeranylglyceryl/heptaprenylglyceryl phosphate synthase [Nonlabens antarcticus]|uniref:geranylgeranylglyceryl/heptaprenylglyceryl phosphate synthase n=1 Tax=Nonlabens antarcticus TaxID=392714 RepID=UPI001E3905A7|nr:geranylgeranylglyceryl/heptaprenylglyceryl phosphate synthase [Nonlabens antarcticus]
MSILQRLRNCNRTLGILVDPEKLCMEDFSAFAKAMSTTTSELKRKLQLDHIIFLIGGSTMESINLDKWLEAFRKTTQLELLLFPGSHYQISENADGLLFLNLISGRNPQYLIGEQVKAAEKLRESKLEIIPTAYILVDGGVETAVARVSETKPIAQNEEEHIIDTAIAGHLMGNKLIYLEAGSGARTAVKVDIISKVVAATNVPVIVGGGLCELKEIEERFNAGVKMVVVGTAIEQNLSWIG